MSPIEHDMPSVYIREIESSGRVVNTYALSTKEHEIKQQSASASTETRFDIVPDSSIRPKAHQITFSSLGSLLYAYIAPYFLPHGYPHSVTPDYTSYQIYDSLQAFASSIANQLSSRAVLQTLGMNSSEVSGTTMATYATIVSIARSTVSNLSTILFADHMSSRIAGEVKFYRFLADIFNDSSALLEVASPSLPISLQVPCLCLSSGLRAMTGVAGGASKAILSTHFALNGNIGELNAKDGSQETLVGLLGMWAGGIVVSKVEGLIATWFWVVVLLSLHLWFNWLAVTSVRIKGLNCSRAGTLFIALIQNGQCLTVDEVGRNERVFEKTGMVRDITGRPMLTGKVGIGVRELMQYMEGTNQVTSGSKVLQSDVTLRILECFAKENYLMWFVPSERRIMVALKEGSTREDQLKAWCHAVRIALKIRNEDVDINELLRTIKETLSINNIEWNGFRRKIEDIGWDLTATVLESTPGTRWTIFDS